MMWPLVKRKWSILGNKIKRALGTRVQKAHDTIINLRQVPVLVREEAKHALSETRGSRNTALQISEANSAWDRV